ncbi:MAG: sodium/sugar symporter [Pseudarcicella sp.]|nr:sodium/sugar symporter [Pseudarcicella sp.]
MQTIDYIVFLVYFVVVAGYGVWIYNRKKSAVASSNDFFLAEGTLTWWAIGTSLIASNISAEQFIGMAGSGFSIGLGISSYEWIAAATLMIVAVFFMPIYLKNKIFTMPQFLKQRYNNNVATTMAIFWLILYVVVNLTSILYLGALAINTVSGIDFNACMWLLAIFAIIITLGGMKVIAYTDVIQVFFLVLGGLATTYLALTLVADQAGSQGAMAGMKEMLSSADDHFHMILPKGNPNYSSLPGLTILLGGMWIVNLNYWGCNQYITQRALGADLQTAREGLLFAAFLKILMPIIVVVPGIAAYVLYQKGMFQAEMLGADGTVNGDHAYPVLLKLLPSGLKGLSFAALTAAIVASLAGKANSISTIFTLDIYKKYIEKDASEAKLVNVGKIAIIVSMILAIFISPLLGIDKKGGFQYIQEYTGYISPGIFAVFLLGFFWKRANSNGAMAAILGSVIFSVVLKYLPEYTQSFDTLFYTTTIQDGQHMIPFLDRMGLVFLICVIMMVVLGLIDPKTKNNPQGLEVDSSMFIPTKLFALGGSIVLIVLVILYTIFY